MSQASIKALINQFSGQHNTLTLQKPYIEFCGGSIEGGLFLSQLLYWSDRVQDPDGWFYKTYREWEREIYVAEKQVRSWAKRFGEFLETTNRRAPNGNTTIHYRLNWEAFTDKFLGFLQGSNPGVTTERHFRRSRTDNPPIRNGQSAGSGTAFSPIRNGQSADPERHFGGINQYTSTTTSNTASTTSSSTTKSAREENFKGEVFDAEFWEEEQSTPVNSQEFLGTEIDRGYRTEIKNVPGAAASSTPAADVSGLTPSSSVDVFGRRFSSTAKVDPNYQRFKADYARLCRRNGIPFGIEWKVEAAWDERFPNGSTPDPQFWEGLQAFIELKDEQKQRDGRAIGVLGGVNFLLSDATAEALEMKQESEINPTPTPAMSRTAAYEANLKAVMERTMPELERMYQEQLEIERRQGGSRWRSA